MEQMQVCSLCSLPRTQSLERESARILQPGPASTGTVSGGPALIAERSELPGIAWVNSSTSRGGQVLDVRAKMRGLLRGDLQVSVDDGMLVVEALVHEPAPDIAAPGRTYRHKFHVCLVGEEVDEAGIRATFRDSVLEVKIPLLGEQARLFCDEGRDHPSVPSNQSGPPSPVLSLAGFVHLFLR